MRRSGLGATTSAASWGDGTTDPNITTAYRTTPVQVARLSDVVAIATWESMDMIA